MFATSLVGVNEIFGIINFVVLCLCCIYVFRQRLLPLVAEGIEKQKAEEKEVTQQASLLVEQQQHLEREISEQQADTEQLKQRIAEWTDACVQKRQKAEDERKKAQELLKKRYAHQVACQHTTLIQQAVRPQAVDLAADMLRKKFSDPAQGDRFIASIVEFMEAGHHE